MSGPTASDVKRQQERAAWIERAVRDTLDRTDMNSLMFSAGACTCSACVERVQRVRATFKRLAGQ